MRKRTSGISQGDFFEEDALISYHRLVRKTIQDYVQSLIRHQRSSRHRHLHRQLPRQRSSRLRHRHPSRHLCPSRHSSLLISSLFLRVLCLSLSISSLCLTISSPRLR